MRWGLMRFTLMTDSASVFGWLKSVIERTHKMRTRALGEMLIRWRLDMIAELIEQESAKNICQASRIGSQQG